MHLLDYVLVLFPYIHANFSDAVATLSPQGWLTDAGRKSEAVLWATPCSMTTRTGYSLVQARALSLQQFSSLTYPYSPSPFSVATEHYLARNNNN